MQPHIFPQGVTVYQWHVCFTGSLPDQLAHFLGCLELQLMSDDKTEKVKGCVSKMQLAVR